MHQLRIDNGHQQHRAFQRPARTIPLPHQSINARQYWRALARQLATLLPTDASHQEQAWNQWVYNNPIHVDLNRLIVKGEGGIDFQLRAAVLLLVPNVTDFRLYERPGCHDYRNLLHIVRGWFPSVALFPEKQRVFLCKLLLLNAHTHLAEKRDLLHYAWCATLALDWSLPVPLQRKLITFLESMLPLSEREDEMLRTRILTALRKAKMQ